MKEELRREVYRVKQRREVELRAKKIAAQRVHIDEQALRLLAAPAKPTATRS